MRFRIALVILLILSIGFSYYQKNKPAEKNTPKAFLSEVYEQIYENYWEKVEEEKLIEAFKKVSESLGKPLSSEIKTKDELIKNLDQSKAASIAATLLASLPPLGRSGLYTEKQTQALNNTVSNINPEKDLYKDLGVQKGASEGAVTEAFEKKEEELKGDPYAGEKLKEIAYAKEVLTDKDTKNRYDKGGVEPTIFTKIIGQTLYLQFKKFSPSSLEEFEQAFEDNSQKNLDSLILDLRGNFGGAIDSTASFLGFFMGKNQPAFEFYKKGEYLPFRTQTDKIPSINKYKQIVVLIDNNTQSSAEMMAASFKRYHLGLVMGAASRGWGTVERVFPIDNQFDKDNKYALFLVHSITLRDDSQPIEGRGVEPDIKLSDTNWQSELFSYFRNQGLLQAVRRIL